jgi:ribokinase
MAGGVLVVGSFNVDHAWTLDALPVPGETRSGRYASGPGGKGFNQAVASARAGAPTRFVCALGQDAGGQLARALAVADGIDLRDAASPEPTGTAGIFVDAQGRNSIVVAAGANATLQAAHVDHESASAGAPAVVLAQLETPHAAATAALSTGRRAGALTVLNPAPADARPSRGLIDLADVLTPNETEFVALLAAHAGIQVDAAALPALADAALHAMCRTLLPAGTVIVTLGGAGCFVSHGAALRGDAQAAYRVPAAAVSPVDTTGAGDAFSGALAASIATRDGAFTDHVNFASRYAALSTERAGAAWAMPRADELAARFG